MNVEQAEALLEALGTKLASQSGDWVRAPCPLAPWLHKSGKDTHPSFGLYVHEGEPSRFHCFTCESGNLAKLLQLIEWRVSESPGKFHGSLSRAREIVENEQIDLPVLPAYAEFGQTKKRQFEALPDWWLESFKPASMSERAMDYLHYRLFGDAEVKQFDLRYDQQTDRLCYPYRDVFGRLAGVRGRAIQLPGEQDPWHPHHDYVWNGINNASLVWFNEQALDQQGPVVVVEGQADAMRVHRVYPLVVANMTAKPVVEKVTKLAQADGVVLMMDGDDAGRAATKKFSEFLDMIGVRVAVVLCPWDGQTKTDPDKLGENWIADQLIKLGLTS